MLTLAGCGGDDSSAKETKAARSTVDYTAFLLKGSEGLNETGVASAENVTKLYIEVLRENLPVLGAEDARRRLADLASEVDDWCPDCAAALDRERERLE